MRNITLAVLILMLIGGHFNSSSLAQTDETVSFHPDPRLEVEVRAVDGEDRVYLSFTESGTCKFVYATTDDTSLEPWPTPDMIEDNNWGEQDCRTGAWEIKPQEWGQEDFPNSGEQAFLVWLLVRDGGDIDWTEAEAINVSPIFGLSDGYLALVLEDTDLLNAVLTEELGRLETGQEFIVIDQDDSGYYWGYPLQNYDGFNGFVASEAVEFALQSGPTFREYSEQCVASVAYADQIGFTGYTHEIKFNVEAPEIYTLYFNSEPLTVGSSENARQTDNSPITFELGGGWIARDIVSQPTWEDLAEWQLVWPC